MFASEPPPTRPASSIAHAEFAAEPDCLREQRAVARQRLHRRAPEAALDLECGALERRAQRPQGTLDLSSGRRRGDTHVDDRSGGGRDDVGTQAAVDRADVHRDAVGGVVQREQALHLTGELEDRADPVLEVGARVRWPSVDREREAADALARDL